MYRLILLIIAFVIISKYSYAEQDSLDFKTVDYKTYGYYVNQNWDSLIYMGNKAIVQNIDYYYLRVRLGVAYFSIKKFMNAVIHFEHALKFNAHSEFALEYLYYSYIYSSRETEAQLLSKKMSDTLKSKIKIPKNTIVSGVYAEGGYIISNNESKNQQIDFDGIANIYGETDLAKDKYFFNIGLQHNIGKKLSIYQSYNYMTINQTKIIESLNTIQHLDNYQIFQQEYYLSAAWYMKNGFKLTPAFHYSNMKSKTDSVAFDTVKNNFVASLSLLKHFSKANVSLYSTYSNFDKNMQIQAGLLLTIYPFSNLKFYSTSGVVSKNEFSKPIPPETKNKKQNNTSGMDITSDFVFYELLGVNLYKQSWFEVSATYGNLKNYNELNAMVIYNTFDKINYKIETKLFFQLNKQLRLSLSYQYSDFTGTYYRQNSFLPEDIQTLQTNYQNHLITGGIKWNF